MSHYNVGLEQNILATLFTVEGSLDLVSGVIIAEDFYAARHQELYSIVTKLHSEGSPYDYILIMEYLETRNLIDSVGGYNHLSKIMSSENGLFNFVSYAERIKELSRHRALSRIIDKARITAEQKDAKIEDKINEISASLLNIEQNSDTQQVFGFDDMAQQMFDQIDRVKSGIKPYLDTGFPELDDLMQVSNGDLVIVAARPSQGKSLIAVNMQSHLSKFKEGASVFFSVEMNELSVFQRIAASECAIPLQNIKNNTMTVDEWARMQRFISDKPTERLKVVRDTNLSVSSIRSNLVRLKRQYGSINSIGVDYLQLMAGLSGDDSVKRIGDVTRSLKIIADEFGCPVFLLSQLNRAVEKRPNKRPTMSDLRDSGSIEQDADIIAFIYREDYYKKMAGETDFDGMGDIIIGKNRNGETGTVRLAFEGHMGRFSNHMPHYQADQIPPYGEQA